MADSKLWSPGKAKPCWIIWYEDEVGAGSMRVYAHQIEAEDDIREMLRRAASGELENWDPDEDDERVMQAIELLKSVLAKLGKVWDALSDWQEYVGEYDPDGKIHVEEGTLYGA